MLLAALLCLGAAAAEESFTEGMFEYVLTEEGAVLVNCRFGEALPEEAFTRAQELAIRADVMLVLGTSLTVFPAAGSSNSAIEMTCEELEKYSSNFVEWVDVCKGWRPEEA